MASVKAKFRPSVIEGKEGTVYYQIIQNRVIRQLKTDYRIFADEWNDAENNIIIGNSERSNLLLSLQERMKWDLKRFEMTIRKLGNQKRMRLLIPFRTERMNSHSSTSCRVSSPISDRWARYARPRTIPAP